MVFAQSDYAILLEQILVESEPLSVAERQLVTELEQVIHATSDLAVIESWLSIRLQELPQSFDPESSLAQTIDRLLQPIRDGAGEEPIVLTALVSGASAVTPFTSWSELMAALDQPQRIIDLIATYGTHETITDAITPEEKQTAAALLAFGSADLNGDGVIDASELAPVDRLDFLNATGGFAGGALGGVALVPLLDDVSHQPASADFAFESEVMLLREVDSGAAAPQPSDDGEAEAIGGGTTVEDTTTGTQASDDDQAPVSTGPAVDARLQFVDVGLDGRVVADGDGRLQPNAAAPAGLLLLGTEGDDDLVGSDGDDTVVGGSGNDHISGGDGNDTIDGGAGNDTILGGGGDDAISSGLGDDIVLGGDGNDVIYAGGGSDVIEGGAGDDVIDGDLTGPITAALVQSDAAPASTAGEPDRSMRSGADAGDIDTVIYRGQQSEYEIKVADRVTTVSHRHHDASDSPSSGGDGVDRLTHIERLQFADKLLVWTSAGGDTFVWQVAGTLTAVFELSNDGSDGAGPSHADSLDLSGIDWLLGADGDMFDFRGLADGGDINLLEAGAVIDLQAGELDLIGQAGIEDHSMLLGIYDNLPADYIG
ncbi:MAG: hypothetical protein R3D57_20715 [Hyphomicrobiaceae bacterium]